MKVVKRYKFPAVSKSNHYAVHLKLNSSYVNYTLMYACYVISGVSDSATLWTIAHQAPLSMGFSRHEYFNKTGLKKD